MNRIDLRKKKIDCDEKLSMLKIIFETEKLEAKSKGSFLSPSRYGQLGKAITKLKKTSQELQLQISEAKKPRDTELNNCFRDAAQKVLDKKTYLLILDLAHDLKNEI